jgi:hypothetical protein
LVVGGSLAGIGFRAWRGELAEQRQLVSSLEKVIASGGSLLVAQSHKAFLVRGSNVLDLWKSADSLNSEPGTAVGRNDSQRMSTPPTSVRTGESTTIA